MSIISDIKAAVISCLKENDPPARIVVSTHGNNLVLNELAPLIMRPADAHLEADTLMGYPYRVSGKHCATATVFTKSGDAKIAVV